MLYAHPYFWITKIDFILACFLGSFDDFPHKLARFMYVSFGICSGHLAIDDFFTLVG